MRTMTKPQPVRKPSWVHEKVVERFWEAGIDIDRYSVLIARNGVTLDGYPVEGWSMSIDNRWICLPVVDEEASVFFGEYAFKPQCFEIVETYETFISNGAISALTQVYLLSRK